jgi:low temperature requirement protein LtrA
MRTRGHDDARVAPIELFFDLVYVLGVTRDTAVARKPGYAHGRAAQR